MILYRYTRALAEKTTNKIGIGNLVQPKIFLRAIDGPTRAVSHAQLHFKIPDWQNSEGRQLSLSGFAQYIQSCQHRIEKVLGFYPPRLIKHIRLLCRLKFSKSKLSIHLSNPAFFQPHQQITFGNQLLAK